jgi:hypothetical protein
MRRVVHGARRRPSVVRPAGLWLLFCSYSTSSSSSRCSLLGLGSREPRTHRPRSRGGTCRVVSYDPRVAWCTTTRRRRRSVVRFLVLGCMQSREEKPTKDGSRWRVSRYRPPTDCCSSRQRPPRGRTTAVHRIAWPPEITKCAMDWDALHLWSRHSTSLAHQLLVAIPRPILLQVRM